MTFNDSLNFVALDIETSGLNFIENEILEIGAVKFENGSKVDNLSIFIKPKYKVPKFIKMLTHISDAQLENGTELDEALNKLKEFCKNTTIVCHNTSFDIKFINTKLSEIDEPNLRNDILDTLELSKIYFPFIIDHKLGTLTSYFDIKLENAHRAIFDAEATGYLFLKLTEFITEKISMGINNTLLQISNYAFSSTDISEFLEKVIAYQKKYALLKHETHEFKFSRSNIITNNHENIESYTIDDVFSKDGLFSKNLSNYEIREGQIKMSKEIENSFKNKQFLLVEAGTGVGKSLAYLIPSIQHSYKINERVVVSTNTKNLQDQLFYKDLPFLKKCISTPFNAVLLKGRDNYICEKRWMELINFNVEKNLTPYEAEDLMKLVVWKHHTRTGDVSENTSFQKNSILWKKVVADRFNCPGKKCSYFSQCYLMKIRKASENASLVIINHSLLLSDILRDNSTLGNFKYLVIDETHNMPNIASKHFGISIGYYDINNLFSQLVNVRKDLMGGLLPKLKSNAKNSKISSKDFLIKIADNLEKLIIEQKDIIGEIFKEIHTFIDKDGNYGKLRIKKVNSYPNIFKSIDKIADFLVSVDKKLTNINMTLSASDKNIFPNYDDILLSLEGVIDQNNELIEKIDSLKNPDFTQNAVWFSELRSADKSYPSGIINLAPLDVSNILNEFLYEKTDSLIFTSATITIRESFKYFLGRMGLTPFESDKLKKLIVNSPFDYSKQAKVYVTSFLPSPSDKYFDAQSSQIIMETIKRSNVGTLILFTSYKNLDFVFDKISGFCYEKDIPLIAQGKGLGRSAMLDQFKEHGKGIMLGTNSFWEGVDVQGKSLSFLILYKLPFQVPSDPIVEAYIDKLEKEGKNSFMHYMLPNALLKYRQGFGRLIRSKTDNGIVLVLDNRIKTKRYGHYFKEMIPAKTEFMSNDLELFDKISDWFSELNFRRK
jgi:predicted DnaQ family exonuclease/DinG family helicase